jgi:hypothetical protein
MPRQQPHRTWREICSCPSKGLPSWRITQHAQNLGLHDGTAALAGEWCNLAGDALATQDDAEHAGAASARRRSVAAWQCDPAPWTTIDEASARSQLPRGGACTHGTPKPERNDIYFHGPIQSCDVAMEKSRTRHVRVRLTGAEGCPVSLGHELKVYTIFPCTFVTPPHSSLLKNLTSEAFQ